MRTRTSPRNQEILFKALFKGPDQPKIKEERWSDEKMLEFLMQRPKRHVARIATLKTRIAMREANRKAMEAERERPEEYPSANGLGKLPDQR